MRTLRASGKRDRSREHVTGQAGIGSEISGSWKIWAVCAAVLAEVALPTIAGCGRKGRPLPPEGTVPAPVQDLAARSRAGGIQLSWSVSDRTLDGREGSRIERFVVSKRQDVYAEPEADRRAAGASDGRAREGPEAAISPAGPFTDRFILEVPLDKGKVPARTVRVTDSEVSPGFVYEYVVRAVNGRGDQSPPSNLASLAVGAIPWRAERLKAVSREEGILLRWREASGGDGRTESGEGTGASFRIFRREISGGADDNFPDSPLGSVSIATHQFLDGSAEKERTYAYVVRAARPFGGEMIEGPSCEEVLLRWTDETAPAVPSNVRAIPSAAGILLKWNEVEASDLLGYHVYRRRGKRDPEKFERMTGVPLREPAFHDSTAEPGVLYQYGVTAVDRSPNRNESSASLPVEARR